MIDEYPVLSDRRLDAHRRREGPLPEGLQDPADDYRRAETLAELEDRIDAAGLTKEERAALVFGTQAPNWVVAFGLGVSVSTVEKRQRRARAKLGLT